MYCKIATTVHLYCRTTTRTMDVYIIWLLVHMSINNIILANGFKIKTTMFRIRRSKQHDVRKCAMEILNNETSVAGLISDLTGKCEKLKRSPDEQQTLEPGYGYVEKMNFKEIFQPPVCFMRVFIQH
ncbi:uncharacterized protein LOC132718633 [Ruditapes philippinarum]|uniref:uncharacterized protein LOC132718633 n=1 Tax=Ruditapes philippinarum TaxID=129788 RepID=UPI00295AF54A|nr:uncharacterized protein LOC132718633 [Ruditapes philippinarum]